MLLKLCEKWKSSFDFQRRFLPVFSTAFRTGDRFLLFPQKHFAPEWPRNDDRRLGRPTAFAVVCGVPILATTDRSKGKVQFAALRAIPVTCPQNICKQQHDYSAGDFKSFRGNHFKIATASGVNDTGIEWVSMDPAELVAQVAHF